MCNLCKERAVTFRVLLEILISFVSFIYKYIIYIEISDGNKQQIY